MRLQLYSEYDVTEGAELRLQRVQNGSLQRESEKKKRGSLTVLLDPT